VREDRRGIVDARRAARLSAVHGAGQRRLLADALLRAGVSVVLDVPDELCRARLRQRNADGTHDFAASDAEYDEIAGSFAAPSEDEGFDGIAYRPDAAAVAREGR
jgi:hypothetical protein